MQQEKRKFSRIQLPFELTVLLDDGRSFEVDHVEDISVGGCLIPARPEYKGQKTFSISIKLSDSAASSIVVGGEYIRAVGDNIAVRFNRIDPDSLFHLRNLILYNAPDPDKIDSELTLNKGLF